MTDDKDLNKPIVDLADFRARIKAQPYFGPEAPKVFEPRADEWRPIPNFANYEMNYLGHLRYAGSVNTIRWEDLDGVKWYELQTKNPNKNSSQEFVVHIFPMITLVERTFPEIFEKGR